MKTSRFSRWRGGLLAGAVLASVAALAAPTPERALDWTVGSWVGERIDGASGEASPLEVRVEPILGGAGYAEHLRAGDPAEPYLGFTMDVFSVAAGRWERRYSNTSGRIAVLEGEVEDEGRVVWRGATPGRSRESRMVSEKVALEGGSEDGWRRTMWVSEDDGGSWRILWRDELKRGLSTEEELRE